MAIPKYRRRVTIKRRGTSRVEEPGQNTAADRRRIQHAGPDVCAISLMFPA